MKLRAVAIVELEVGAATAETRMQAWSVAPELVRDVERLLEAHPEDVQRGPLADPFSKP